MTSNSTISYSPYTTSSYSPYITGSNVTIGTSNIATSTICISTSSLPNSVICGWSEPHEKPKYKCAYCDTVHEDNTGICDRCGAPLGTAVRL